jgi:hypothetical protein
MYALGTFINFSQLLDSFFWHFLVRRCGENYRAYQVLLYCTTVVARVRILSSYRQLRVPVQVGYQVQ